MGLTVLCPQLLFIDPVQYLNILILLFSLDVSLEVFIGWLCKADKTCICELKQNILTSIEQILIQLNQTFISPLNHCKL